jgi:hypothetical protein
VPGTTGPDVLADLARGRLRQKRAPHDGEALAGRVQRHHGVLVSQRLAHLNDLDEATETLSGRMEAITSGEPAYPFTAPAVIPATK